MDATWQAVICIILLVLPASILVGMNVSQAPQWCHFSFAPRSIPQLVAEAFVLLFPLVASTLTIPLSIHSQIGAASAAVIWAAATAFATSQQLAKQRAQSASTDGDAVGPDGPRWFTGAAASSEPAQPAGSGGDHWFAAERNAVVSGAAVVDAAQEGDGTRTLREKMDSCARSAENWLYLITVAVVLVVGTPLLCLPLFLDNSWFAACATGSLAVFCAYVFCVVSCVWKLGHQILALFAGVALLLAVLGSLRYYDPADNAVPGGLARVLAAPPAGGLLAVLFLVGNLECGLLLSGLFCGLVISPILTGIVMSPVISETAMIVVLSMGHLALLGFVILAVVRSWPAIRKSLQGLVRCEPSVIGESGLSLWLIALWSVFIVTLFIVVPVSFATACEVNSGTLLSGFIWWLVHDLYATQAPEKITFLHDVLFVVSFVACNGLFIALICSANVSYVGNVDFAVLLATGYLVPLAVGFGFYINAEIQLKLVHSSAESIILGMEIHKEGSRYKPVHRLLFLVLFAMLPSAVIRKIDSAQKYTPLTDTIALVVFASVLLWLFYVFWSAKPRAPELPYAALFAGVVLLPANTAGVLGLFISSGLVSNPVRIVMLVLGWLGCGIFILFVIWAFFKHQQDFLALLGNVILGKRAALLQFEDLKIGTVAKRLTTFLFFFCALFLVAIDTMIKFDEGCVALLIFMFVMLWPFRWFLRQMRQMSNSGFKWCTLGCCCCFLPLLLAVPLVLMMPSTGDSVWVRYGLHSTTLLMIVGGPAVFVVIALGLWSQRSGSPFEVVQLFSCMFVFFPLLVLFPLFFWGDARGGETTAIACISFPFLIGVTVFTIVLNTRMQLLQAERSAKLFIHKLRFMLRPERVILSQEVGRFMYQRSLHLENDETMRKWLLASDDGVVLQIHRKEQIAEIVDFADYEEEEEETEEAEEANVDEGAEDSDDEVIADMGSACSCAIAICSCSTCCQKIQSSIRSSDTDAPLLSAKQEQEFDIFGKTTLTTDQIKWVLFLSYSHSHHMSRLNFLRFCRDAGLIRNDIEVSTLNEFFTQAIDGTYQTAAESVVPDLLDRSYTHFEADSSFDESVVPSPKATFASIMHHGLELSVLHFAWSRWLAKGTLNFVRFRQVLGRIGWGIFGKTETQPVAAEEAVDGMSGEALLHESLRASMMEFSLVDPESEYEQDQYGTWRRTAKAKWRVLSKQYNKESETNQELFKTHLLPLARSIAQSSDPSNRHDPYGLWMRLRGLSPNEGSNLALHLPSEVFSWLDHDRLHGREGGPGEGKIVEMGIEDDRQDMLLLTTPAPEQMPPFEWKKYVRIIMHLLQEERHLCDERTLENSVIQLNVGNILEVFYIFVDLGSMLFVVYEVAAEVGWWPKKDQETYPGYNGFAVLGVEIITDGFYEKVFIACCCVAAIFPVIAYYTMRMAWAGKLGGSFKDEDRAADLISWANLFYCTMCFFASALFFPICKTFVYAFACTYQPGIRIFTLNKINDIQCWTAGGPESRAGYQQDHFLFIAGAVIGGLLYYPAASLIYPTIQFTDRSCDIKYNPTFLVLLIQGKLALVAIAVWLYDDPNTLLICCCCIFSVLGLLIYLMKPCLVHLGNDLRFLTYMVALWTAVVSLLQNWANENWPGERITMGSVFCVGLVLLIFLGIVCLIRGKHPDNVIAMILTCGMYGREDPAEELPEPSGGPQVELSVEPHSTLEEGRPSGPSWFSAADESNRPEELPEPSGGPEAEAELAVEPHSTLEGEQPSGAFVNFSPFDTQI